MHAESICSNARRNESEMKLINSLNGIAYMIYSGSDPFYDR